MNLSVFNKLLSKKSPLLKCIFSTLFLQILITTCITYLLITHKTGKKFISEIRKLNGVLFIIGLIVINIGLIFAMIQKNASFTSRMVFFTCFSLIQSILLGIITIYLPKEVIISAMVSTCLIFFSFLMLGFLISSFNIDLSWLGIILFYAVLSMIIYQIVSMFIPESQANYKLFTTIGLIVFSLYVMYDTNQILLKYQNSDIDCVRGSLDYYLDIVNLFTLSLRNER